MITFVTYEGDFAFVAVACVDGAGAAVDPSSAEAVVYEVSQLSGNLTRCLAAGVDGVLTLSKIDGQTGFYGAALETSAIDSGQYVLLLRVVVGGVESVGVDYVFVDDERAVRSVVSNAVYDNADDVLRVNAWLVEGGAVVADASWCGFELYDSTGVLVFAGLESFSCDGNGVFRLEKAEPGLSHDRLYYGRVSVMRGSRVFVGFTGLVTVE